MSELRDQKAKVIQDAIRQVLCRNWDPIGVCDAGPEDEYDSYIAPIYRLLTSRPKSEEVRAELRRIEASSIGVGSSEESLATAARKLLVLDIRLGR